MSTPIKWLVVGDGLAGRVHQTAIPRVDDAELAGVVFHGSRPESNAPAFSSIDAALNTCEPDVAVVATPNHTHVDLTRKLLAAAIPVLCEKPVGRNADEARLILELSEHHEIPVGVVLNQRFCRANRWVRELIHTNALDVQTITFELTMPALHGWQANPRFSGGGLLRLIGIHYLDLLCWWLGQPTDRHGHLSGDPIDDDIDVSLAFPGNRTARLRLQAKGTERGGPIRCRIAAAQGDIELLGHTVTSYRGVPAPPPLEASYPDQWFGPGHLTLLKETSANLIGGRSFPVTLADALPSLMQMDSIYSALR